MDDKGQERRYWRDRRSYAVVFVVALVVLWRVMAVANARSGPDRLDEGIHTVERVIDGQTLLLASGARVRLQGIELPEGDLAQASAATEAAGFTQRFIARAGGKIRLTFGLEREDGHGQFLAFVWHGDVMLNEELVRAGFAHADLDYRRAGVMRRRLAATQEEARRAAHEKGAGPITALPR